MAVQKSYIIPTSETSTRMKRVRSSGTSIEKEMECLLREMKLDYEKQPSLPGKPDFRLRNSRILIFCDSSFWHGRLGQDLLGETFHRNKDFWVSKLKANKRRDVKNNAKLRASGWSVQRFWDKDILKNKEKVKHRLNRAINNERVRGLTAVDLFCGAGGLSLGLEQAGFNVVAGVELNTEIAKTYATNHPNSKLITEDVRKVSGNYIKKLTGVDHITLLAGCPPCQGFSQLTEKHKRIDPRNQLPLEMARLVEELQPDMVMMENVPGLANKGKPILDQFVKKLESLGYVVKYAVLQLADYGVPQTRTRLVLFAGKGFEIPFPVKMYSRNGKNGKSPWRTLKSAIGKLKTAPITLAEANQTRGPSAYAWNVVRTLSHTTIARLKATKAGGNRRDLPKELRPECHKKSDYGFTNVYGRLAWDKTPGTITSGCTTLSMGRFGHPNEERTISVREAACIQTFPLKYVFKTEFMDAATIMVGNALPPKFSCLAGKKLAKTFLSRLNGYRKLNIYKT